MSSSTSSIEAKIVKGISVSRLHTVSRHDDVMLQITSLELAVQALLKYKHIELNLLGGSGISLLNSDAAHMPPRQEISLSSCARPYVHNKEIKLIIYIHAFTMPFGVLDVY